MTAPFALSAHLGYLFTERPLEDRFAAAARAGFRHVEHPAPYALPAARTAELCRGYGLVPVQIALPAGGAGEKGLAAIPGREDQFARTLDEGIAYAVAIGCRQVHPMAGVPPEGADPARVAATYRANLTRACAAAEAAGLDVIIEPIGAGTLAGYYLNHPDMAVAAIADVGAPNLRLSFDAFHAAGAGVDPAAFTAVHGRLMAHVQVADTPGRHEPGTGSIDFSAFFASLDATGYPGVIGLEYKPRNGTEAGLAWAGGFQALRALAGQGRPA